MRQYSSRIEHTPKEICRARATLLEGNPVAQISVPPDAASKHRHRPGPCANISWNPLALTNGTCLQLAQHNLTGTSCLTFKKWKICCHISAGRTSSIPESAIFSVFLCSVEVEEVRLPSSQNRRRKTWRVVRKQTRDFCTLLCVFLPSVQQLTALYILSEPRSWKICSDISFLIWRHDSTWTLKRH